MNINTYNTTTPEKTALADFYKQAFVSGKEETSHFLRLSEEEVDSFSPAKQEPDNTHKDKYVDPLLTWPLRGLAFTNDIGAAIMDIAPTLGALLWIPALMYFGADIYDKYKSDEKEYNPDKKRAFKQAIFQALASITMPIIVVHNGQKAASALGQLGKSGMSLQLKEEIEQFTVNHLKRRRLQDYNDNIDGFKQEFNEHLKQHLFDREKSFKTQNPFKLLGRWIFSSKHGEKITDKKLRSIEEYSNKNIDEMFSIRRDLLQGKRPSALSDKLMKFYEATKSNFAQDKNTIEGYIEDSIKAVLKKRQRNELFKIRLLKSVGGFVALGATIQFIDHFIEKQVMKKFIEPGIENFEPSNWQKNVKLPSFMKK